MVYFHKNERSILEIVVKIHPKLGTCSFCMRLTATCLLSSVVVSAFGMLVAKPFFWVGLVGTGAFTVLLVAHGLAWLARRHQAVDDCGCSGRTGAGIPRRRLLGDALKLSAGTAMGLLPFTREGPTWAAEDDREAALQVAWASSLYSRFHKRMIGNPADHVYDWRLDKYRVNRRDLYQPMTAVRSFAPKAGATVWALTFNLEPSASEKHRELGVNVIPTRNVHRSRKADLCY